VPSGYLRKTQNLPPLSAAIRFSAWRKVTPLKSKDNFSSLNRADGAFGGRIFKFIDEARACTSGRPSKRLNATTRFTSLT